VVLHCKSEDIERAPRLSLLNLLDHLSFSHTLAALQHAPLGNY